jgi:hypothetical protein
VFRIGDRNLINTVIGSDFQRALSKYELSDLGDVRGVMVWSGELATERREHHQAAREPIVYVDPDTGGQRPAVRG